MSTLLARQGTAFDIIMVMCVPIYSWYFLTNLQIFKKSDIMPLEAKITIKFKCILKLQLTILQFSYF
jgi:hypothetical protein